MNTLDELKERLLNKKDSVKSDSSDAYEAIKESVAKRLEDSRSATRESIDEAINSAVASVTATSEHTKEQINQGATRLRRELEEIRESAAEAGRSAIDKVTPGRPRSRFLVLASAAMGVGTFLLGRLSSKPRSLGKFDTGDTAGPGLFVCHNCDTRLQLESETRMPECSNCHNRSFSQIR